MGRRPYAVAVAHDEGLAARIRDLLGDEPDVTERSMFGGRAFFVAGNLAVSAASDGGLLVRVDPADSDALVEATGASLMEMRGRPTRGWLRLSGDDDVGTDDQLEAWVVRGVSHARSLPPKG